ncbi:MAG: ribonuclease HI [Chloroflexi bacterium]|nr:ribonuclease HI [Chloroflexota bacterium]
MTTVDIITDGACSGNPGHGGWATIIVDSNGTTTEFSGSVANTTNNQMELTAIIEGLQRVAPSLTVHIYTDSQYVINGITKWVFAWQKNGWKTKDGSAVENQALWRTLVSLTHTHVHWHYVRGHNGHTLNERANTLAQQRARAITSSSSKQSDTPVRMQLTEDAYPRYISLVGSEFRQHATWGECKHAVHGVSGALFKKVRNADELAAQRKLWKVHAETP